jgi:hypothetical protein
LSLSLLKFAAPFHQDPIVVKKKRRKGEGRERGEKIERKGKGKKREKGGSRDGISTFVSMR